MGMQIDYKKQLSNLPDLPEGMNPLDRVLVPIEHSTSDGRTVMHTLDRETYERKANGQIINHSRVRGGKKAKKARMKARQHANN